MRSELDSVVTVPTVERELGVPAALLERDGGRQPGDHFHLGVVPLLDEPPGVGRHGLEVAALRLGVDGAEGQGGLAGAGDAGERDDRVAGHVHVHVAQVVLAGAADPDKAVRGMVGPGSGMVGAGKIGSMLFTLHLIRLYRCLAARGHILTGWKLTTASLPPGTLHRNSPATTTRRDPEFAEVPEEVHARSRSPNCTCTSRERWNRS